MHRNNIVLCVALCALSFVFSILSPYFLSFQNFSNILLASSLLGILGLGASLVLASAGLDLSIGSVMALSGVASIVIARLFGFDWYLTILICLFFGGLIGFCNGFVITQFRIPAFIVTLGMLGIARGLALIISDGRPIYGLDPLIIFMGQGNIWGISVPVIIMCLSALIVYFILRHTRFGRYILCMGDNEQALRKAGVSIKAQKIKIYVLSGVLTALAGLLFMGRVNSADPAIGLGYELNAITVALIGGTSLFGGKASVIGVLMGALLIGVLQNGLNLLAVPSYYQQVAIGLILILSVSLNALWRKEHL